KEWQALEAGGQEEGVPAARVPALLQMAANQVQQDMSLTEGERKQRAEFLLARTDDGSADAAIASANGTDGNAKNKAAVAAAGRGDAEPTKGNEIGGRKEENGTGNVGEADLGGGGGGEGGGARQEQLASLLCKAEQYSMFIRQSQMDVESTLPIAPKPEVGADEGVGRGEGGKQEEGEEDGGGGGEEGTGGARRGGRKRASRGTPVKKSRSFGGGQAFSSAASKMEKAKEEAKAKAKDDASFRQPANLVGGSLKPYQLEGLRWLVTLYENGLSGILADEMGLGKTIQVIALIAHLRTKNVNGPFLVTAPLATLPNWVNEFRKWLPSAEVLLYHGSKEHRAGLRKTLMKPRMARAPSFPVVVTSYENTLEELWSLLNFVNPHIFDDLSIFRSWFGFKNIGKDTSVESIVDEQQHSRIVSKLHEILRPFLIRRMKKDVLAKDGLPPKREVVVYAGMSSLQRSFYELAGKNALREALVGMGIEGAARVSEININMNQRKVCQHPFLFGEPKDKMTGKYAGETNPEVSQNAS
ncbi:unnamed protein product, partial [Laminaria digitata]